MNPEKLLEQARIRMLEVLCRRKGLIAYDIAYAAPETLPGLESPEVIGLALAICDLLSKEQEDK
jgi:hypothetical protein